MPFVVVLALLVCLLGFTYSLANEQYNFAIAWFAAIIIEVVILLTLDD